MEFNHHSFYYLHLFFSYRDMSKMSFVKKDLLNSKSLLILNTSQDSKTELDQEICTKPAVYLRLMEIAALWYGTDVGED